MPSEIPADWRGSRNGKLTISDETVGSDGGWEARTTLLEKVPIILRIAPAGVVFKYVGDPLLLLLVDRSRFQSKESEVVTSKRDLRLDL